MKESGTPLWLYNCLLNVTTIKEVIGTEVQGRLSPILLRRRSTYQNVTISAGKLTPTYQINSRNDTYFSITTPSTNSLSKLRKLFSKTWKKSSRIQTLETLIKTTAKYSSLRIVSRGQDKGTFSKEIHRLSTRCLLLPVHSYWFGPCLWCWSCFLFRGMR